MDDEPITLDELYAQTAIHMLAIMIRDPDAWERLLTTLGDVAGYAAGEESSLFHSETIVYKH